MILSPKLVIDEGWITGIKNDCQVQPNAVEFTLDKVYEMSDDSFMAYDDPNGKTIKQHRTSAEIQPVHRRGESDLVFFHLNKGVFDVMSDVYVDLPENVALLIIVRSTFNRNGIFLTSGLYDSGYKGHIGCALHNWVGDARIGVGTRLGQAMFVQADSVGLYAGGYNHDKGEQWNK